MSAVCRVRREVSGCRGGAFFKLVVALAVIFAAVALAWMLFLPTVVTAQLRQRTGFDARVQRLTVNPFTGNVELQGLVVTNPPTFPVPEFVDVREFKADADVFSLLSDRAVFNSVLLDVASVTLVKREDGVGNAEAFQNHLTATEPHPAAAPSSRPTRRFLIRRLTVKMDRLVIVDHSSRLPRSREYRLKLNQSYSDVTEVRQLLAPAALQSLAPVAEALTGLVPGDLGSAIGDAVKGATKAGENLLKASGRKAGEKAKGYFDALEESRKP